MANRSAHKKLRAEIRGRMTATGESYQQAYARVATRQPSANRPRARLVLRDSAGPRHDRDARHLRFGWFRRLGCGAAAIPLHPRCP
jgi:hypothetical protein